MDDDDEEKVMKIFGKKIEGYPKYVVLFSAIFLIALGLCGLNGEIIDKLGWHLLGPNNPDTPLITTLVDFNSIVGVILVISGFCLMATIIFWMFESIGTLLYERFAKPKDELQRLLDDTSEQNNDEPK